MKELYCGKGWENEYLAERDQTFITTPTADRKLKVFLCHTKEDKTTVHDLHHQLTVESWLDEIKLGRE